MTPVTVSVSVLIALGGLEDDDPAAVLGPPGAPRMSFSWYAHHPRIREPLHTEDVALLPASAPALLRVLARHLGWTLSPDEVPAWHSTGDGFAFGGRGSCEPHYFTTDNVPSLADPSNKSFGVIQEPMRGLAVVLVHLAEAA